MELENMGGVQERGKEMREHVGGFMVAEVPEKEPHHPYELSSIGRYDDTPCQSELRVLLFKRNYNLNCERIAHCAFKLLIHRKPGQ